MRVTLASLPWQTLHWPSSAVSVLDTVLSGIGWRVTQFYGNLLFAEQLLDSSAATGLTPDDYHAICDSGYPHGVGEWIFTSALYHPYWRVDEFKAFLADRGYEHIDIALRLHEQAPAFVEECAQRILDTQPHLVGLTSTFEQNVPSLAVAAALKRRKPDLPIVMGGANCDGPMGAAIHRNFPQIDMVVRGEGERPVRELAEAFSGQRVMSDVTSLCWRDETGASRANPYVAAVTPGPQIPVATMRPFFDAVNDSPIRPWINGLSLRLETSRGCWWGEKRHCTFCGLNGGGMAFRSKPPDRAFDEITQAVKDFGLLDVMLSDNILDPTYVDTLLPRLAALDWDLRIFYEVKSNLKPTDMAALSKAGVTMVQPGIESLSSRVLSLMDKGATGPAQVRSLRLFREHGIEPRWNYLYGFPGEDWTGDYAPIVAQMPALVHLPPPNGMSRIYVDRFAPLFDNRSLGFDGPLQPTRWYPLIYDLPKDELTEIAYSFEHEARGIGDDDAALLGAAIEKWRREHETSRLTMTAVDSLVVISDARQGFAARDHTLEGDRAALYLALSRHMSVPGLLATARSAGLDVTEADIHTYLSEWFDDALVFQDGGFWVALAVPE
ncbi:MAG TPA: RiPP maturation radical SAM C-methyltransferase [Candidatus Limnocylindrales bacterium]|nr:RiPP maturation radical SAM C-methyltransferase [Candidatus Limnocylindrales bacterium]